jgi:hypothetical protein
MYGGSPFVAFGQTAPRFYLPFAALDRITKRLLVTETRRLAVEPQVRRVGGLEQARDLIALLERIRTL